MYQYQGKPTAYLDQNILSLFVNSGCANFADILKFKLQVVYSDETLKEIERSGDHAEKFLSVLKNFDAYHLKIVLEQPCFIITDKVTLISRDPFEAYEEYLESKHEYNDLQLAMEQSLYKFSGGRVGDEISVIHDEQKEAFSGLIDQVSIYASELSQEIPCIEGFTKEYGEVMKTQFEATLDETERIMKENFSDDKNWSGIKEFRDSVGIGPKELNNIEPPDVLKKIWKKYKVLPPYNNMDSGIEAFLGIVINPINPDQPYFNYQKVAGIYNMLNTLGYYPDSEVHKERRFVASLSDTSHASMASFCSILLSRDKYFVKKVQAAYEFLGIPTLVVLL